MKVPNTARPIYMRVSFKIIVTLAKRQILVRREEVDVDIALSDVYGEAVNL